LKITIPVLIVIMGTLLGFLFEKVVFSKLTQIAEKTKWKGDDIIIRATSKVSIIWFFLISLYIAFQFVPIPARFLELSQKALLALIILSFTFVAVRIATGLIQLYGQRAQKALPSTSIFVNITKVAIITVGFLIVLQTLGISVTPLLTALGVGGIAIALGLQETLSNLFAGLHIILSRQVRVGDFIKLETGEEGYVTDITWRNTTVRMLPNNIVVVPNSKLASSIVTNYYLPAQELAVLVQVGVSYDSDLEHVERVTIEVGKEVMQTVKGGIPEFTPFIRYHTFDDFSINFTVILRAKEFVDQYMIKHEFIKRLHKRYKEEGIEIPFPIRTVYMREKK